MHTCFYRRLHNSVLSRIEPEIGLYLLTFKLRLFPGSLFIGQKRNKLPGFVYDMNK